LIRINRSQQKNLSAANGKLTRINKQGIVNSLASEEKKPQLKERKIDIKRRTKKNGELDQASDQSKTSSTSVSLPTSNQQPKTVYEKSYDQQDSAPYYIDNAGLILLWPYLKTLFDNLGYLENKVFSTRGMYRAIHLLSFLAYGKQRKEEHLLLLPKILCGCLQEQAISQNIRLNKKEKTEGLSLIEHAIANWSTLKKHVCSRLSNFISTTRRKT